VFPEIVLRRSKRDLHKRAPFWPLRFADQAHVRFTREAITLTRITGDARANHVFPNCRSAPVARHDVIQIKVAPIKNVAAVLAGVLVPLEYIVTREFYFFLRKPVEHQQHDHPRDTNLKRNRGDHFMVRRVRRQVAPAVEIVRRKVVRVIRRNNLGVPCINERKGPAGRANVYRLPEPVQNQNLTIQ